MSDQKAAFFLETNVSRETFERLEAYAALLERWNNRINLVSSRTLSDLWVRHFLDSAQLVQVAPAEAKVWADLGSGAGFPGAVVAILSMEHGGPDVFLVESDKRKAEFLRTISRETGAKFQVICDRAEAVAPLSADVISARALAPLDKLLGYASQHLRPGGRALFLKGQKAEQEVVAALEHWSFDCETYPSKTDPGAVILSIGEIKGV